ncbi:MAG: hypothetical protein H8D22_10370 [Candidatus Cloacimonetes bacterium]|nr:hypothetical protein [Candidatus Cloacimonadota bacterium]
MEKKEISMEEKMHHYMGIEMNIQTWNLLGKEKRTDEENAKMIYCALASRYHWLLSPYFQSVNEQRAEWLLSRVFAVLNKPEKALHHAKNCMNITKENDLVDFDLAYAYEAMARAFAVNGNKIECEKYLKLVKETGKKIKGEEDKKIFFSDFDAAPWYDLK